MNIVILGGAGFIGSNLALSLAKDKNNNITVIDKDICLFRRIDKMNIQNIHFKAFDIISEVNNIELFENVDVVYHLVSTTIPSTSNKQIIEEFQDNVLATLRILDSCVSSKVKQIVFLSSGGTVYGNNVTCPIKEEAETDPISSYGIQKLTIEKLLYLYNYLYGLDYRIIRLSNPYGPYQRPNGVQGVVTTFIYKVLKGEELVVYGDGSVVRDFIYIDDAISGIINISSTESKHKIYNLGSGKGVSVSELISIIEKTLNKKSNVVFHKGRNADIKKNYLDISRYENEYGMLNTVTLEAGILLTSEFLKTYNGKE